MPCPVPITSFDTKLGDPIHVALWETLTDQARLTIQPVVDPNALQVQFRGTVQVTWEMRIHRTAVDSYENDAEVVVFNDGAEWSEWFDPKDDPESTFAIPAERIVLVAGALVQAHHTLEAWKREHVDGIVPVPPGQAAAAFGVGKTDPPATMPSRVDNHIDTTGNPAMHVEDARPGIEQHDAPAPMPSDDSTKAWDEIGNGGSRG